MKKTFLVVYDYGTGGVWRYMNATSPDEIRNKYPQLHIIENEPDWFTDEIKARTSTYDIDEEPDEFLSLMIAETSGKKAR